MEEGPEDGFNEYPVHLGLAYLFLVGYIVRTLFVSVGLPSSVGVMFTGFGFTYFFQADLLVGRDLLQQLSFFLVLLTAGLEISLRDLKPHVFVMAWLPATCELVAVSIYAQLVMSFTPQEGMVLGTVLVALGDGLVIPKMKEFGAAFPGHPLPKLVFTWAPLEASFALALFGVLMGISNPAHQEQTHWSVLAVANVLRIAATLVVGVLMGTCSGWLISRRGKVTLWDCQMFTDLPVEGFLMLLAVALAAFGLGAEQHGKELVPIHLGSGSLFQPELLVIVTGSAFAWVAEEKVLHDMEVVMGGVWVFGQLILFSMLGSRTELGIFPQLAFVLPVMGVGLVFRLFGVFVAIRATADARGCRDLSTVKWDTLFCFLSTLPRATIQGALGAVPATEKFFSTWDNQRDVRTFIFVSARLYIVCMSIGGMLLLNTFGPHLLAASAPQKGGEEEEVMLPSSAIGQVTQADEEKDEVALQQETLACLLRAADAVSEGQSLPSREAARTLLHMAEALCPRAADEWGGPAAAFALRTRHVGNVAASPSVQWDRGISAPCSHDDISHHRRVWTDVTFQVEPLPTLRGGRRKSDARARSGRRIAGGAAPRALASQGLVRQASVSSAASSTGCSEDGGCEASPDRRVADRRACATPQRPERAPSWDGSNAQYWDGATTGLLELAPL